MNHASHRSWLPNLFPKHDFQSEPVVQPTQNKCEQNDGQAIRIKLGDVIAPLLAAAKQQKRWVEDFADDQIVLSRDLYEVICAYEGYQSKGEL